MLRKTACTIQPTIAQPMNDTKLNLKMAKNAAAELQGPACPKTRNSAGETGGESGHSRRQGMNELATNKIEVAMLHHLQLVLRVNFMV